jgi:hypothetical protein
MHLVPLRQAPVGWLVLLFGLGVPVLFFTTRNTRAPEQVVDLQADSPGLTDGEAVHRPSTSTQAALSKHDRATKWRVNQGIPLWKSPDPMATDAQEAARPRPAPLPTAYPGEIRTLDPVPELQATEKEPVATLEPDGAGPMVSVPRRWPAAPGDRTEARIGTPSPRATLPTPARRESFPDQGFDQQLLQSVPSLSNRQAADIPSTTASPERRPSSHLAIPTSLPKGARTPFDANSLDRKPIEPSALLPRVPQFITPPKD